MAIIKCYISIYLSCVFFLSDAHVYATTIYINHYFVCQLSGNMSARRLIIVGQLLALSIGIVLHSTEASNSSVVVASSRITDLSPSGVKVATIGDNEMRIKVTSDSYGNNNGNYHG